MFKSNFVKKYPMYLLIIQQWSYLDAVVRETLRLHPPLSMVLRAAGKDGCIPLNTPFKDMKGMLHNEIRFAFSSFFMLLYSKFLGLSIM